MSNQIPHWQLFRKRENDLRNDVKLDIPTQPKIPWSSSKENSILNLLDEETREYRNTAEHVIPRRLNKMDCDNNQKKKFGNFMGKLLLQSKNRVNKPVPIVQKEKILKQQVLTDEPFAGLFRMRKNRIDQSIDSGHSSGISKKVVAFSLKPVCRTTSPSEEDCVNLNDNAQITTTDTNIANDEDIQKRKSRWDIQCATSENKKSVESESNNCEQSSMEIDTNSKVPETFDISDDDDQSCVDSLQSDDDVLGPWIELGMVDPMELNKMKHPSNSIDVKGCLECVNVSSDRQPLKILATCPSCRFLWSELSKSFLAKIKEKSTTKKSFKKRKRVQFDDCINGVLPNEEGMRSTKQKQTIKKNVPASFATSELHLDTKKRQTITVKKTNKSTKAAIPPTKSHHSQKTNQKIMAFKNQVKITTTEKSSKNETGKKSSSYFTTGAFMTRNAAKTLADPHNGFYPNPYGFVHHQNVEVLNINGHWYRGTLEMMDKGKVKVKYSEWDDQEEWIIMGSRRLRLLSSRNEPDNQTLKENEETQDANIENNSDNKNPSVGNPKTLDDNNALEVEFTAPLFIPTASKQDSDYISSTLDRDPSQIFNNNEVFMTRRMARELIDEYGFKPNSFGYRRNRAVAITFFSKSNGSRKTKQECVGYLREMHKEQVRVWYPELHQSEWLPIGSRRLRVLAEDEEKAIIENTKVDLNVQEVPPTHQLQLKSKTNESVLPTSSTTTPNREAFDSDLNKEQPTIVTKKTKGKSKKVSTDLHTVTNQQKLISSSDKEKEHPAPQADSLKSNNPQCSTMNKTPSDSTATEEQKSQHDNTKADSENFLTTGAFATRRAMRQLKDKNGFTPNPYGYTNGLGVEVLNTRSGKTKFWEYGRLVAMCPGQVRVHYEGWADIYDEWIMVGSRRIRIATSCADNTTTLSEVQKSSENPTQSNGTCSLSSIGDLLIAESNPEVNEDFKKNRKHQLVRPQDYQELGMLINLEELAIKEAEKKEKRVHKKIARQATAEECSGSSTEGEENDKSEYVPSISKKNKSKKLSKNRIIPSVAKIRSVQSNTELTEQQPCNAHMEKESNTKQIISLRLAHAHASKNYQFVANVYGYDYMQHVTVLHIDKKVYEGRLVSMHKDKVKVHYCGWIDKFDEYITLGSRRLQAIENDHEVECIEPTYQKRYEQLILDQSHAKTDELESSDSSNRNEISSSQTLINRFSRKRLTLEDIENEEEEFNRGDTEYHKDMPAEDEEIVEIETWKVYCNQCNVIIKQFRYYCTYCETPSLGHDYQSFELCLRCFDQNFPFWHDHPRSSFAIQAVIDAEIGPRPIKGELVTVWEEDILEDITLVETSQQTDSTISSSGKENSISLVPPENMQDLSGTLSSSLVLYNSSQNQGSTSTCVQPDNNGRIDEDLEKIIESENKAIDASKIFTGAVPFDTDQGYKYLKRWKRRKVCAFCNDDDDTSEELGQFIGPFVIATFNKNGVEKKRSFWAHDSCARYSPEVFCTPEGKWYNVTLALRRGRGMRCHGCKEKGATIGCFESKCNKSFHLPCSQKPVSYFKNGVIFWCGIHEAYYNKKDTYVNIFNCDGCSKQLAEESWFTCVPCTSSYFSSFDLCTECYEQFPSDHPHNEDDFEETSFAILKEMEAQKATEAAREKEEIRAANAKKRKKPLFPRRKKKLADGSTPVSCCYCGTYEAESWRKGYDGGVIMCNPCFELALLVDNDGRPAEENMPLVIDNSTEEENQSIQQHKYVSSIEDYSHKPYFTRDTLSANKFSDSSTGVRLASYEPQPNQLFSLTFNSTYFDIPGRAPRWATHSGTDYHGTWLPQTVRRAILKYTSKNERVLSNFLGRGTDAIECFLLQRRCCGVDINPAAVSLSQRNCCFEVPPGLTSAEYRPVIVQADSRKLSGALFSDESFHHILSHPPYKDCVAYSTHLDGDLSRYANVEDFKIEYAKVVQESWRLLKIDRRLTLGIGDNREHCFYIPVGFHLMRIYIDQGFELEELVIKRQRYCSAFGLGTYLCVQFDFLVFTHEFIATFKKVPKQYADRMILEKVSEDQNSESIKANRTIRGVPSSAIMRKSVVMGTVWVFKPTEAYAFDKLCISRMVERFGKDDGNWEHIELELFKESHEILSEDPSFLQFNPAEEQQRAEVGDEMANNSNEDPLSEYEQERLRRINENNKTLLKLGLISELSEESEDVIHYETMMSKERYENGELVLMITGHRSDLLPAKIEEYRRSIVNFAKESVMKLAEKGMFIVGTQDIRDPYTGKLWPLTMLVLEDIEQELGRDKIKLKEMVVTVPGGYSKDRKKDFHSIEEEEKEEKEDDLIDIETVNHDGEKKWTSQDEKDFESAFRLEALKVDLFINRKQREIESRVAYCERSLARQKNMSESTRSSIDDALTDILADLNELSRFTRINFKALENLIQEHDRLTNTNLQSLFVDVCRTRPLDNQRFDKILVQVSSLLDICRNRLEPTIQSKSNSTDIQQKHLSAKYWIHKDNLTEVKAILLFNLPMHVDNEIEEFEQIERSTSTIYLDNDRFSQYSAKLQYDDGADIINCRWYGKLENTKKVSIGRKTFIKPDKGRQPVHERIELEQSRVADFISQRYSAEEYANDLKSNTANDQDYVNSCYTIAQSIQDSIAEKQLEPKLRVYFNRMRFKLPQDHTFCITLDNDVAFIKEGGFRNDSKEWCRGEVNIDYPFKKLPREDLYLFPHSILEMQTSDGQIPVWLSRLLDSKLVYEVPRFSTYLHGVSQFWRPMLPLLPWWLPRLDIDIRKDKQQDSSENSEFTGLTRSKSLKPLIDGYYRMGYLESQLGKKEDRKRHLSSSINSIAMDNIGNQMNNDMHSVNLLVSDNKNNTERSSTRRNSMHISIDQSSVISQHTGSNSSINSKTRLRSRNPDGDKNSSFIKTYYDERNDQSQAYMLQDVNTVREDDALRKNAIIEMEEEAVKEKKEKKRKPKGHTMEPKQFFANERTFIHWLQFSAIVLMAALTLLNFGDTVSTISGATFFGISLVFALYAFFRYRYRAYQISTRPHIRYDDLYGPVGLCVLLLGAMILNFVLRWEHPSSTTTYLGTNNQTDQQNSTQAV